MARTKKEIDKELMYKKLMPSSVRPSKTEKKDNEIISDNSVSVNEPVNTNVSETKEQSSEKRELQKQPIIDVKSGVQFKDQSPCVLVNVMESLVVDKLEAAFKKFNCCKCDKCKKDVAAIALNKLRPKYVVKDADKISDYIKKQTSAEVTTAVVQAIITVKTHPRH